MATDPYAELVAHLEETRADLTAAVAAVPPSQRQTKPSPEAWSVAEVIEHLALVERAITRLIRSFIARARAAGATVTQRPPSIVGSINLAAVRNRAHKVRAQETMLPVRGLDAAEAWQELEQVRHEFLQMLVDAPRVELSTFTYPHYVLGPLNGYQWLAFVAGHEARHSDQIRAIASSISHCV